MIEINLLIKSTIILSLALMLLGLLKKAVPAYRFNLLLWSFFFLLLLPLFHFKPIFTWAPATTIIPPTSFLNVSNLGEAPPTSVSTPFEDAVQISTTDSSFKPINWVRYIWVTGSILMFLSLLFELFALRFLPKSKKKIPAAWEIVLQQTRQQYGIRPKIKLAFSPQVKTVFTYGYFKPVIVLPGIARNWEKVQIRAVLLHELAHIKRRDFLTNLLVQVVKVIYWFNPLVWIATSRIRLEAEQACDDLVLQSGMQPWEYGQQLVDAAKMLQQQPIRAKQLSFSITGGQALKKRMQSILNPDRKSFSLSRRVGILLVFCLISILFSSLALEPINPRNLSDANPAVRIRAIQSLGKDFSPAATKQLLPMLKDSHYLVREKALLALGQIGSSKTFYNIKNCMADPHPQVRVASLYALSEIACLPAYRVIADATLDVDPIVQKKAMHYLDNYNRQKLIKWLKTGLKDDKNKTWITNQFQAIQRTGHQEALLKLLAENNHAKEKAIGLIISQIEQPDAFHELRKVLL